MTNINIKYFLENHQLLFKSNKQAISWLKRNLKPTSLIRIGPNYLVNKEEIEKLFKEYLIKQKEIRKNKSDRAKKLTQKKI
jgi:hypothetical protein